MVYLYYQQKKHQRNQLLPQSKIKRKARTIPFGYKLSEDTDYIEPIELELQALEKAKEYLKTCSLREVAIWLTKKTGRYISYVGLRKRVKRDTTSKAKEESQAQSQAVG
jgi:hypothetical protein